MDETDDDLIREYLAGDEGAFKRLVERHLKNAYNFALRFVGDTHEADDIAQESFVKVWKNLKKFDRKTASFKTWLMHIVRNTSTDHLRKKKALPFSSFEDEDALGAVEDEGPLPDELAARLGDAREVERALLELPPAYREIIILRYQQGLPFEEIAQTVGAPQNTIKSRHRRALHRLKSILRI